MADERTPEESERPMTDEPVKSEEAAGGEYGVGQILNPDEEALAKAREKSSYHYSQEELEHQEDRIDE